jgi:hypothetical protein
MASVIEIIYQRVVVVFVRKKIGCFDIASVWIEAIENQATVVHVI